MKLRIVIESPYASETAQGRKDNITYLRRCLRDSLMRGEAPFASHAIYTQYGVLDDSVPEERHLGIDAGVEWGSSAKYVAIYVDRGISEGMKWGIAAASRRGAYLETRALDREVTKTDLRAVFDAAGRADIENECAKCHRLNEARDAVDSSSWNDQHALFCDGGEVPRLNKPPAIVKRTQEAMTPWLAEQKDERPHIWEVMRRTSPSSKGEDRYEIFCEAYPTGEGVTRQTAEDNAKRIAGVLNGGTRTDNPPTEDAAHWKMLYENLLPQHDAWAHQATEARDELTALRANVTNAAKELHESWIAERDLDYPTPEDKSK